ncbi:MAG: hypothetical protein M0D55_09350 [Elusimicrobiota bacterium]|nr:MAG: hypothetical protein M0D55_09350 [Elusimicrobiota bacterium]
MNNLLRSLLLTSLLAASAQAGPIPEGSWGSGEIEKSDIMSLIIKADAGNPTAGWAVLAEYTRLHVPIATGLLPERLRVANWVPRMYLYRVGQLDKLRFSLSPVKVSASGGLEIDTTKAVSELTLAQPGTLAGGTLARKEDGRPDETIVWRNKISSTWEGYVPGDYFGSKDSTGGDYLHKRVNTRLSKEKVADFFQAEIVGKFDMVEAAPGIFTFKAKGAAEKGADKVLPRIAVFIDIVNWKPFFTTDELMLINVDDARDVGFYYERH